MKATELRIGNLVYEGNEVLPVGKRTFTNWDECNLSIVLKPIPLTKEWLEKLGWVWNDECNSYEKYPKGDARMNLSKSNVNSGYTMFNYVLKANISNQIFFVHQLQNLVYAMTGEELIIK